MKALVGAFSVIVQPVAASMGCPGYPWISLWFQYFRIRRHISPNPATYFDILLNNRTGVQLAGYPYDSKEMPPLLTATPLGPLPCLHSGQGLDVPSLSLSLNKSTCRWRWKGIRIIYFIGVFSIFHYDDFTGNILSSVSTDHNNQK